MSSNSRYSIRLSDSYNSDAWSCNFAQWFIPVQFSIAICWIDRQPLNLARPFQKKILLLEMVNSFLAKLFPKLKLVRKRHVFKNSPYQFKSFLYINTKKKKIICIFICKSIYKKKRLKICISTLKHTSLTLSKQNVSA